VFVPDPRRTLTYRFCRGLFTLACRVWWRPVVVGREQVPTTGPMIIAPVHRSFADFGFAVFLTDRKLFFIAKDSLWKSRLLGRFLLAMGAFPVHRESADREALRHAEEVLRCGETLVLFPEGTRQEGPEVQPFLAGAAFLAGRCGATIVPVGIGNSDRSMPKGARIPKPLRIRLVVGEPIPPPPKNTSGRVPRSTVQATTEELHRRIQKAYDRARG
jgi:1-acyl-sn-glycerol-3-phosphate acyltransferase